MIMLPLHGQNTAALQLSVSGQAILQKLTRRDVFVKQADNVLKVAHCTKQRYDKAYFILRCIMFGMFFKKSGKVIHSKPSMYTEVEDQTTGILCFPHKCFKLYGHRQIN
jgi:hypothetical protein